MSADGLRINVKVNSIDISKGFFSDGMLSNETQIEFYGAVSEALGKSLLESGIDTRADFGSQANLKIQFEDSPFYQIKESCVTPSIGWLEVFTSIINDPEATNPVCFRLSITLPNSDLPDIIAMSNCEIQVEPVFNLDEKRRLVTVETDGVVQFNVARVIFKPLVSK